MTHPRGRSDGCTSREVLTNATIRIADWDRDRRKLQSIRHNVFVIEQNVPVSLEWDDLDPVCTHVLAIDDGGNPLGTGRLLEDGHIGRMAVLRPWRGHGIGSCLLQELIRTARQKGLTRCVLNAQVRAIGFYERHGFVAEGEVFDDAGIPHRRMVLDL